MKNKFLILSLLVCSFFTACSSDDDGGNNGDPIVGEWRYSGYTVEGEEEEELSECDMLDTMIFNANGTYSFLFYYESDSGCELDGEETGTWTNKGSGIYAFTYEDQEVDGMINFSNNNNTLSIISEDGESEYTEIYTRVTE